MKFPKKLLTWLLMFVLVLGSVNVTAFAAADPGYNHGTIGITTQDADSENVISLKVGETATITITPYMHVQYQGCGMPACPSTCEEYAEPGTCFKYGYGCSCDTTPVTKTATVTAEPAESGIVTASNVAAVGTLGSAAGSTVNGAVTIKAEAEGETTVTVNADLYDWIQNSVTYTVKVTDGSGTTDPVDPDPEPAKTLTGIEVTTAPTKTEYAVGESFDPTGMVVTAKYDDGTTAEVTNYSITPEGELAETDTAVTVSYTEGEVTQTATVAITVTPAASDEPELVDGYYELYTEADLQWFADQVTMQKNSSINGKLMANIELTEEIIPIGSGAARAFSGTFDGNGFKISNIQIASTITYPEYTSASAVTYRGLFGCVAEGTIKNLTVEGEISCTKAGQYLGGLVAYASKDVTIENCTSYVDISAESFTVGAAAGILAYSSGTSVTVTIKDSMNYGEFSVSGAGYIGGIVGNLNSGKKFLIENCGNEGVISGGTATYTAGLVGRCNVADTTISKCYNTGTVNGDYSVAGLVGYARGTIEDCYSVGDVTSASVSGNYYAGGLIAQAYALASTPVSIENCYSSGTVSGAAYQGGLIGYVSSPAYTTVANCYSLESDTYGSVGKSSVEMSGITSVSSLDELAGKLGDNWEAGKTGYPVLTWQNLGAPAAADDWVEIDDIEGLTDISAKGFAIRHLDSEGNVLSATYFTEDEMRELAEQYDKTPYYYTFGCGMQSYPSLAKGEGVKLTDILGLADIDFTSGQKLMLRATDVLAEEMEVGTVSWRTGAITYASDEKKAEWEAALADVSNADDYSAYYTYFTYEYLMGTTRYSFAKGMAEAMLTDPNLTQAGLYSSQTVIQSGLDGGAVSPLLCFGFNQIYANQITSMEDITNLNMSRGDAYRFCFGQALDENGNISSANTRFQTAYNVFGIDVVDTEDAPAVALEGTAIAGQSAVFTITAGENAYTDGYDFQSNITEVSLIYPDGSTKVLSADEYETGYRRVTGDDGSYYIGIVTLAEGVLNSEGQYTISMKAATYQDAKTIFSVSPVQEAPTISSSNITLRYTGELLTIKVTNGTDDWASHVKSVAITDADGNETVLDASQYEVTAAGISLNRTADEPIMSVSTAERTADYTIKVVSTGYEDASATFTAVMYGAETFQVRLLDGEGNVVTTRTFTMDEIKEMSSEKDAYYNTICGMTGIRTFKAHGVLVSELLKEAGVTFGEGMTLQLRTNDAAESENDSATDNAYYRLGTFTYEDLMQPRYYFPDIFTDNTLHDTLINGSKFGEDVRTALAKSTKVEVEPMIASEYVERIYRTNDAALTEEDYDSLVSKENAFRFLFGIAMDSEDASMISGTTTTWSASYDVFGIDIIDPNYVNPDAHIVDFDAYTDHSGDLVDSSMGAMDTQTAYVTLTFDKAVKIADETALIEEMNNSLTLGGSKGGMGGFGKVSKVSLSDDGKTLAFEYSGWLAPTNGWLKSSGVWTNLTTEDGGYANSEVGFIIPNGLQTVIVEQVIADEENNASVTTQIVNPGDATRGMVHLSVLKNGQPIGTLNANNAMATGHWHDYLNLTTAEFLDYYASTVQDALGEEYEVTYEGDLITITALNSQPGDVLEFHIVSYLNDGSKAIDANALNNAIANAQNIDAAKYTTESYDAMVKAMKLALVISSDTTYYAQTDVDTAADNLLEAIDKLVLIEETENPGTNGEKPGTNGNEPGTNGNEPGTNGNEPGTNGNEPGTNGNEPDTNGNEPGTEIKNPNTQAPGDAATNPASEVPGNANAATPAAQQSVTKTAAKTSDNNMAGVWVLVLCAGGAAVVVARRRKQNQA